MDLTGPSSHECQLTQCVLICCRFQGKRIDDTAANSMKVQCRELVEGTNGLNERKMGTGYGFWGTYGDWSNVCAETTAVCGIRTKVEGDRGPKRDDTGLNDLELYCCE